MRNRFQHHPHSVDAFVRAKHNYVGQTDGRNSAAVNPVTPPTDRSFSVVTTSDIMSSCVKALSKAATSSVYISDDMNLSSFGVLIPPVTPLVIKSNIVNPLRLFVCFPNTIINVGGFELFDCNIKICGGLGNLTTLSPLCDVKVTHGCINGRVTIKNTQNVCFEDVAVKGLVRCESCANVQFIKCRFDVETDDPASIQVVDGSVKVFPFECDDVYELDSQEDEAQCEDEYSVPSVEACSLEDISREGESEFHQVTPVPSPLSAGNTLLSSPPMSPTLESIENVVKELIIEIFENI